MGMSLTLLRRVLYASARTAGDVRAVQTGTVGKRIVRRAAGKLTARILNRLFR